MFEEMKLKDLIQLAGLFDQKNKSKTFLQIGKSYFIRTVTMYHVGRLIDMNDSELLLEECSWIADTGRFSDALKFGEFSEIEPFPTNVILSRGCIIDTSEWLHKLPVNQK